MPILNDDFLGALVDSNPSYATRLMGTFRDEHESFDGSPDDLVHVIAQVKLKGDDRRWLVHHTTDPTTPENLRTVSQAWVGALKYRDHVLDLRVWRTLDVGEPEAAWMIVPIVNIESVLVKPFTPVRPNLDDERRAAGFHPPKGLGNPDPVDLSEFNKQ